MQSGSRTNGLKRSAGRDNNAADERRAHCGPPIAAERSVRQTTGEWRKESTVMTERADESAQAALRNVVRDVEAQQRRNGWLLTTALLVVVVLFRWLSEGPYAANSIYFALVLVVIGIRAADHQLARGVSRLAKLVAGDDVARVG